MGPLTPLSEARLKVDFDKLNKYLSAKVDFNPANYTQDQLRKIRNAIDEEFMVIRTREHEIDFLNNKAAYEHQWVRDADDTNDTNLYYIIKLNEYDFTYLYMIKDYLLKEEDDWLTTRNNISIGIGKGRGRLVDCFKQIEVVDLDEVGIIISKYKEDIDTLINNTLKENKDE